MTEGLRALRFIQISAPEATPGTAQAATEVLRGNLTPPVDDIMITMPENEERNSLAQFHSDAYPVGYQANLVYNADVIFRYMTWLLSMAIRGNVTATQPDATNQPNAYLWAFEPSLTAANTPDQANGVDTFTMEYGDNTQGYETEYCFGTRVQISGAPNETCRVTENITGRQRSDATKTPALSLVAIQRAPFNLAEYYRDANWAALGTTQKTGIVKAFTWSLDTMLTPRFTAEGSLYFGAVDEDFKSPELRLVLVRGTESEALRAAYEAQSVVYVQMKLKGATELDSGQTNPPYLEIDGAYQIPAWPAYGDDQGMATIEVPLRGCYDTTGAKMMLLSLLNGLAAFPT
jgi:hypothetical protein